MPQIPKPQIAPLIAWYARPITKIIDDKKNAISIIPKKSKLEEANLSEQLTQIFPNLDEIKEEEDQTFKETVENLTETLGKISEQDTPFEFEFFAGGKNEKLDDYIRGVGPSTENIEFLDFLQSDFCKKIMIYNKLKIHIETGNIYYDNKDANESILSFLCNQQNPINGIINFDFVYGESYKDYFNWLKHGFDIYQKSKLDILQFKSSKYLFYRWNDILQESNLEIKKIKHSSITDDYIATEEIQNQNWQYFVESSVLEVSSS